MKRVLSSILTALAMLAMAGVGVQATPAEVPSDGIGPYEGTFRGVVQADGRSSAPLWLFLTHRDDNIAGVVYLGSGLQVDAGFCGSVDVPATAQYVKAETSTRNPRQVQVAPTFDVGGFEIAVDLVSTLSTDGKQITARAKIDVPWFCGRDPVFTGRLDRQ